MGDMLPWALDQLRNRLPEMLTFAGGGDLVPKLDRASIDASLRDVEKLACEAQVALKRQQGR